MSIEKPNANIVVFEDDYRTLNEIKHQLDPNETTVVAQARSLGEAFEVLEQLASDELTADVILLDGNLLHTNERPVFDFTLPISPEAVAKKGLFGRIKAARPERIIVDSANYTELAGDAKAILEVMQKTNISSKVIGISSDELLQLGVNVDVDLTKDHLDKLASTISALKQ